MVLLREGCLTPSLSPPWAQLYFGSTGTGPCSCRACPSLVLGPGLVVAVVCATRMVRRVEARHRTGSGPHDEWLRTGTPMLHNIQAVQPHDSDSEPSCSHLPVAAPALLPRLGAARYKGEGGAHRRTLESRGTTPAAGTVVVTWLLASVPGVEAQTMDFMGMELSTGVFYILLIVVFLFVVPCITKVLHIVHMQVNKLRHADLFGGEQEFADEDEDDD